MAEKHSGNDNNAQANTILSTYSSAKPKPLFAAAGFLHSASFVTSDGSSTLSRSNENKDDNDLSSLKLVLEPSTLDAIINVQKPQSHVQETQEYAHRNAFEGEMETEETSHKRKISPVHNNDDFRQETSPKKRKRSKKHRTKKKHKHRKRSSSDSSSPGQSSGLNLPEIPKHVVFLDDMKGLKPEQAFHVDKTSNKDLWNYQSVSKQHIAKYKSFSFNCLGATHLSSNIRGERKGVKKKGMSRYFKKEDQKYSRRKGLECIPCKKIESTFPNPDFLTFSQEDSEKEGKTRIPGNYSCLDDSTAFYIQGKDAGYSKQPETNTDNFIMDEIFEKVRHFNQKTREDPQNVQLWLDFVQFQDVVAQENKSFKGLTVHLREVYQPSKSVIEKKLAVLEKAIEANPSSLELKMAQLELYQDIWESDKLEKAWGDLLFTHSANVDLWRHYLSKQQSQLLKFSFGRILKCYHKCFRTLVRILDGQMKVLNKKEDMEEKMLGLFAQYCNFLHQSGYTERAVSSFQAIIEFNLFCPASLNLSMSHERLKQFEEFWDSYVPRFGEQKAKGWAKWTENSKSSLDDAPVSVSTDELEDAIVLEKLSRSQTWLKMEKVRQDVQWLPWRPNVKKEETMEDCEDLDRVVLFDDISPAVFRLTKSESCIQVLCLFLKFLNFSSETLEKKFEEVSGNSSRSVLFDQYSIVLGVQLPSLSFLKCGLDVDAMWQPHECLVVFTNEVLTQTEAYFSSSNRVTFTLLRLELEVIKHGVNKASALSKSSAKSVKRFGKSLLKENHNRNNLVVWDSYIRLLWACSDKMEETVSMLDTALAMSMATCTISDSDKALGLCLLCKTYSQIMLNFEPLEHVNATGRHSVPSTEDKHQAIACLGALVEKKVFKSNTKSEISPAYILKIRKRFQTTLQEMYTKGEQNMDHSLSTFIIALNDCFALFEYCASGFKAASIIYDLARENVAKLSQTIGQTSYILNNLLKQLYLSHLSFFTNVRQISLIPLTEIRQILNEALEKFPECQQLHTLFLEIESGSHIIGRLRKYYERGLKNPVSLTVPLFAVMSELTRHYVNVRGFETGDFQQTDSGIHRVRSVFEHSLQSQVSGHCPLLWKLYLMFEAKYGTENRAKGIFYRALQNCPWAKCIYMHGIAIFGDSELQEVMDLMTEKEIRVRMPLEEVDLLLTAEKKDLEGGKDENLYIDDGGDENVDATIDFVADKSIEKDISGGDV